MDTSILSKELDGLRAQLQELVTDFEISIRFAIEKSSKENANANNTPVKDQLLRNSDVNKKKKSRYKSFVGASKRSRRSTNQDVTIFICNICKEGFEYFNALHDHSRQMHSTTDFTWEDQSKYSTECVLVNKKLFMCEICGAHYKRIISIKTHIATYHKRDKNYCCKNCGDFFSTQGLVKKHELSCTVHSKPLTCPFENCIKRFKKRRHLNIHVKNHAGEHNHECDICHKKFVNQNSLINHGQSCHNAERSKSNNSILSKCVRCNLQFDSIARLGSHYRLSHKGEKMWNCDLENCDKCFVTYSGMVAHKDVHSNTKNFICDKCGKAFLRSTQLQNHELTHAEERRFQCEVCGKGFNAKCNLILHTRLHTGEKPLKCHVCPAAFANPLSLQTHVALHFSERPYKCNSCDKTFKSQASLRLHERIKHLGKSVVGGRVGICSDCGKSVSDLPKHMVTHTGERPFSCEACGATFTQSGTMHKHRREKHGLDAPSRGVRQGPLPLTWNKLENHTPRA